MSGEALMTMGEVEKGRGREGGLKFDWSRIL